MTDTAEMLDDSKRRIHVPGCRHQTNKNMAQRHSSMRHKGR
jgi:hypothetical protein